MHKSLDTAWMETDEVEPVGGEWSRWNENVLEEEETAIWIEAGVVDEEEHDMG